MSKYVPMTGAASDQVMFIDHDASRSDLHDTLEQRLGAATDLLCTLGGIRDGSADYRDLANVSAAAHLLLEDATDLLRAIRSADHQEGSRHE